MFFLHDVTFILLDGVFCLSWIILLLLMPAAMNIKITSGLILLIQAIAMALIFLHTEQHFVNATYQGNTWNVECMRSLYYTLS